MVSGDGSANEIIAVVNFDKGADGASSSNKTIGRIYSFWSILNAATLIILTLVLLGVHREQVATDGICALTLAGACPIKGGSYRAINFTAETTSLTYTKRVAGSVQDVDASMQKVPLDGWPVLFDPDEETADHIGTEARCKPINVGRDTRAYTRCLAEGIQVAYEVPNPRNLMTLAGGVHLAYLTFVVLHIAASFAVLMLPSFLDSVKAVVLPIWHMFGIILFILISTEDNYFGMRVPANNILLAAILETATLFVQYMLTVNVNGGGGPESAVVPNATPTIPTAELVYARDSMNARAGASAQNSAGSKLSSLMRLGVSGATTRIIDRQQPYNTLGVKISDSNYKAELYNLSVFDRKLSSGEIIETIVLECAITLPTLLVVVFSIAHRNAFDFLVESFYVRSFLAFSVLAILVRIRSMHVQYNERYGIHSIMLYASVVMSCVSTGMFVYSLADWMYPISVTLGDYNHMGSLTDGYSLTVSTFALVCVITGVLFLYTVFESLYVFFMTNTVSSINTKLSLSVYMLASVLLYVVRFILFVYLLEPARWYGAYNEADYLRGYE